MLTFVYCYPAQAVRNYETLSHNAASTIPPNAILIGSLHVFNTELEYRYLNRFAYEVLIRLQRISLIQSAALFPPLMIHSAL